MKIKYDITYHKKEENIENDVNYVGIGILSISFLVITIIFSIFCIKVKYKEIKIGSDNIL